MRRKKARFRWKMQNPVGCLSIIWMRFALVDFSTLVTRRKPPFPYLSSAGQDRKSVGDVSGHMATSAQDV